MSLRHAVSKGCPSERIGSVIGSFFLVNLPLSFIKMASVLLENDAVHSLPPFANAKNKSLSEKVTRSLLKAYFQDQIYGKSLERFDSGSRRQWWKSRYHVDSHEKCKTGIVPYTGT